ncbi:hypothetical protein BYT27DRAFT_7093474, partial [Phlegmacium glaucopus]
NKRGKIWGYASLHAADHCLHHHIQIYKQARWALHWLLAPQDILDQYLELQGTDLQALKSVYMPNAWGQSRMSVPWIWKINVASGSDMKYLNELYRINWLRAWAKNGCQTCSWALHCEHRVHLIVVR